jgi:thiol-disulfide isomerase/thioredoxin
MIIKGEMILLRKILIISATFFLVAGCAHNSYQPKVQPQEIHGEKLLVGELQYRDIPYFFPAWQRADSESVPDPDLINQVKEIDQTLEILCYLGTWCGDSREALPLFMKTLDAANNKNIRIKLIGVDRTKMDPEHTAIQYDIQRVPTFIVFREGQEIGRMIEFPLKENFIEDLLDIVNAQ